MPEEKIIGEWPKCPICGSTEKVSTKLIAERKLPPNTPVPAFTSIDAKIVNLDNPLTAILTVKCYVRHSDICLDCGTERCTRIAVTEAPKDQFIPPSYFRR